MELQQILSKMEADGWEIADDFKKAHGHFLQYFLETVEEALRQPPVIGSVCDGCGSKFDAMDISVGACYCCQKEIKQTDL